MRPIVRIQILTVVATLVLLDLFAISPAGAARLKPKITSFTASPSVVAAKGEGVDLLATVRERHRLCLLRVAGRPRTSGFG